MLMLMLIPMGNATVNFNVLSLVPLDPASRAVAVARRRRRCSPVAAAYRATLARV